MMSPEAQIAPRLPECADLPMQPPASFPPVRAVSQVCKDTLERIVLGGQDIHAVPEDETVMPDGIMKPAGAKCRAPDAPPEGPCPVG